MPLTYHFALYQNASDYELDIQEGNLVTSRRKLLLSSYTTSNTFNAYLPSAANNVTSLIILVQISDTNGALTNETIAISTAYQNNLTLSDILSNMQKIYNSLAVQPVTY